MLNTQQLFLEKGHEEAAKFLSEELAIVCKKYDNFYVLNYNQIFSPEVDPYVMECRSLQVDYFGNVVSRAYPRFFNYGQRPEITELFDWTSFVAYDKVDGSLIRVYYDPFACIWQIATRGTAYAESEQDFYPTFRQAVLEDGFGFDEETFQKMCSNMDVNFTYVFEYCSLKNRIVTPYPDSTMFLIVAINNLTGREWTPKDLETHFKGIYKFSKNIKPIKSYKFDNVDDLLKFVDNLQDLREGVVIQDNNGLRVKIKNTLYLKLHKMRGEQGFTPKKIASVVIENEHDEVLTYFPEYKEIFEPYIAAAYDMVKDILKTWLEHKDIPEQKEFALKVKDLPYSGMLFSMRKTGKDLKTVWEEAREEHKVDLLFNRMGISE